MPGSNGRLTQAEQDQIAAWVGEKWKNQLCPCCGQDDWIAAGHLLKDEIVVPGTALSGMYVPYVVFFCQNCAYVVRFNSIMMNVGREPQPETSMEAGSSDANAPVQTSPPLGGIKRA